MAAVHGGGKRDQFARRSPSHVGSRVGRLGHGEAAAQHVSAWVKGSRHAALAGVVLSLGLVLIRPSAVPADPFATLRPDPFKATTSPAARESALQSIPFNKLDADAQAKVASVLSDVSFFRRMPIRVVQCDPDLYLFLVEHPDVVVNIWDVMGVTQMAIEQTGPTSFQVTDTAGTKGSIEYLYASHDTHLIYTEGSYDGPLFAKPVVGRGLILLKTGYVLETDGRYYITSRMDAFMRVEHVGAELLTKTFSPLVGKVADINFTYTAGFFGSLSRTAEVDHEGVARLAGKLSKVQPEVQRQLAQLAERVAQKAGQLGDQRLTPQPLLASRPGGEDPQ